MANPGADHDNLEEKRRIYLTKVDEMKNLLKSKNIFRDERPEHYAVIHEWLLDIKEKGRDNTNSSIPSEVLEKFDWTEDPSSYARHTISAISQSQSTGERLGDLFTNGSKSPLLQRLKNTIGLNDSYTDKPNGLGAGALGLIGGAVKETKEVYGDGGPISEKTLDLAIEASKELFYELDPSYIPRAKRTGDVFEDYLSRREDDAKLAMEAKAKEDAKDAVMRENNKKLNEPEFAEELMQRQKHKLSKYEWKNSPENPKHHLYKVMERNFKEDSDLRDYVFHINEEGDDVSQLGNKYDADIDFNELLANPILEKYKDEVFLEIALDNATKLETQVSNDKLELLNVIVKKVTDLKNKNEDNYHELVSMLAEPGKYGLGVICPLGNAFLENTRSVSDIVNDLVATGALHKGDQHAISTQQKPKGGFEKNQTATGYDHDDSSYQGDAFGTSM